MIDISKYDSQLLSNSVDKVRCERNFYYFFKKAWPFIATEDFIDSWHIEAVCDHMQAVCDGNIKHLIINIPPRCLKTLIVSVAYHPWVWLNNPLKKFFTGSRSKGLALESTTLARNLMTCDWYQERWGDKVVIDPKQNEKMFYRNLSGGYRKIYSTYSNITGHGGDIIIIDDPMDAKDIWSKVKRSYVNNVISKALMTRRNAGKTTSIILIMQRLHADDPTNLLLDLLKTDGVEHLMLPMEFDPKRRAKTSIFIDPRKVENELLCPKVKDRDEVELVKKSLGKFDTASQYQQSPKLVEGNIIKTSQIELYDTLPRIGMVLQSWDTAFKKGQRNDYSVCITFGISENAFYVMHMCQERLSYPELKTKAKNFNDEFKPNTIIIEDSASGQSLIQELRETTLLPVKPVTVDRDKEARTHAVTSIIEAGKLRLPRNAPWLETFMEEVALFPNGKHDDIVDSLTMGLNYLRHYGSGAPRVLRF